MTNDDQTTIDPEGDAALDNLETSATPEQARRSKLPTSAQIFLGLGLFLLSLAVYNVVKGSNTFNSFPMWIEVALALTFLIPAGVAYVNVRRVRRAIREGSQEMPKLVRGWIVVLAVIGTVVALSVGSVVIYKAGETPSPAPEAEGVPVLSAEDQAFEESLTAVRSLPIEDQAVFCEALANAGGLVPLAAQMKENSSDASRGSDSDYIRLARAIDVVCSE